MVQFHVPPQFLHRFHSILLAQLSRLIFRHQDEIVADQLAIFTYTVFGSLISRHSSQVDDQRVFDSEDRIGSLVGIVAEIKRTATLIGQMNNNLN